MRIGDAAASIGVAAHVLRHWEDVGVLTPARDPGGRRLYDAESVAHGRLVLLCQRAGLSLADIRALSEQDRDGRVALLDRHRGVIAGKIAALERADAFLTHVLSCSHPIVVECPDCAEFAAPL